MKREIENIQKQLSKLNKKLYTSDRTIEKCSKVVKLCTRAMKGLIGFTIGSAVVALGANLISPELGYGCITAVNTYYLPSLLMIGGSSVVVLTTMGIKEKANKSIEKTYKKARELREELEQLYEYQKPVVNKVIKPETKTDETKTNVNEFNSLTPKQSFEDLEEKPFERKLK